MEANLFIALGGTGFKVVSELQKTYAKFRKIRGEVDNNYYFYVDTDELSIRSVDNNQPNTEVLDLSQFRPADFYNERIRGRREEMNKTWFDGDHIHVPDHNLSRGAKAIRQLTRMGFYYYPQAQEILETILNNFLRENKQAIQENQNQLDALKVYVVTGSAGGTGSGVLYDLLYSMWRYYIGQGYNGNLDITAVILMPNSFLKVSDPELVTKYKLNGYAFIQETNALLKMGFNTHLNDQFYNYFYGRYQGNPNASWKPFQRVILVDDSNYLFTFTQGFLYEIISEFLFAYTVGVDVHGDKEVGNDQNTNTIRHLLESALTNSEPDRNLEYINAFGTFGILVMKSAMEYFRRFAENQLQSDIYKQLLGNIDDNNNALIDEIRQYIEKTVNDTISIININPPRLNEEETNELVNVIKSLDFNKELPVAKETKIKEIVNQLNTIKKKLDELCKKLKDYLDNLPQTKLSTDNISLYALKNALRAVDKYYYDNWDKENRTIIEKNRSDFNSMLRSRINLYIAYKLSKGADNTNDKGFIDNVIDYLEKWEKEIGLLLMNPDNALSSVIKEMQERKNNGASTIVPDFEKIVSKKGENYLFNPDGPFFKWYNDLNIDTSVLKNKLIQSIYDDKNENKKYILANTDFNVGKLKITISENLKKFIEETFKNSQEYNRIKEKSIFEILNENTEDVNEAIKHFQNFSTPYIRLTNRGQSPSYYVYVSHFQGNEDRLRLLGYRENINHIKIDDPYFSDRIIKIVFYNKIGLDQYVLFEELKKTFEREYTSRRKDNLSVPSPFIHKDFAGRDYRGDVYRLLLEANKESIKKEFEKFPDELKQIFYKYGLIFLFEYIQKGVETRIFKDRFNNEVIVYDDVNKNITIYEVQYNKFLRRNIVNMSNSITIDVNCNGIPLNYQAYRDNISALVSYIKAQRNTDLSDENYIEVVNVAYTKLNPQTINDLNIFNAFNDLLSTFVDNENRKVLKLLFDYIEIIF